MTKRGAVRMYAIKDGGRHLLADTRRNGIYALRCYRNSDEPIICGTFIPDAAPRKRKGKRKP